MQDPNLIKRNKNNDLIIITRERVISEYTYKLVIIDINNLA